MTSTTYTRPFQGYTIKVTFKGSDDLSQAVIEKAGRHVLTHDFWASSRAAAIQAAKDLVASDIAKSRPS